jgi:hypothetical protein
LSPSTRPTPPLVIQSRCQVSSPFQSETILSTSFIAASPKTEDKVMPSSTKPELNTPLNHGEPVEPSQEFLEFLEVVLPELVKPLLVTCAERLECSLLSKSGENGIKSATSLKEDMLLHLHLLPLLALLLLWPEDIKLKVFQNSHLLLRLKVPLPNPSYQLSLSSELEMILLRSESLSKLDKELVNTEIQDTS